MQPEPGPEQQAIREAVHHYLAREGGIDARLRDPARMANAAAQRWRDFAGLGWLGLPLPEAAGGSGGGMAELWPVLTAFGHELALDPYLPTVVLGGLTLARAAAPAQQASLLPAIAVGELRLALALAEPGLGEASAALRTRARPVPGGWRLDGQKSVVLGAPEATRLIVSATAEGTEPLLLLLDPAAPGVTLRPYPLIDGRLAAEIQMADAPVEADSVLARGDAAAAAIGQAVLAGALAGVAEICGAMEAALARTVAHLRERRQFGRRLADQQALRHRVADMFIACQESAALGWRAALAFDAPDLAASRLAIAAARAQAGPAGLRVCEEAIQLHGALAITDEFPVGHYLKRVVVAERLFGGSTAWLDAYCDASPGFRRDGG